MRYRFILPGRLKEEYLREAFADYLKRLAPYGRAELVFVRDCGYKKEPNPALLAQGLKEEAEAILKEVDQKDFLVLADLHGRELDSIDLAASLERAKLTGHSSIAVAVGGSYGLDDRVRQRADLSLRLSALTFTHPLALLLLVEQIYRANKILNHETYHK